MSKIFEEKGYRSYYSGTSVYKACSTFNLNCYEYDIIKHIRRARFKGEWLSDLEKSRNIFSIYIKEYEFNQPILQDEILNTLSKFKYFSEEEWNLTKDEAQIINQILQYKILPSRDREAFVLKTLEYFDKYISEVSNTMDDANKKVGENI